MPEPFKNYFDVSLAAELARRIVAVYPRFEATSFTAEVAAAVPDLELKGRVAAIATALRNHLPPDYPKALAILVATLGPPHSEAEGMFKAGWHYMPLANFVELYGLDHFDESLSALHAITQRHTAEFAIRPFLLRYQEQTMAVLRAWVHDESFHVRRLVSEGTRTRLPWAARLPQFIADPAPVLALLEVLKDDPVAYVRKSVANNLNDIAKDHPALVLATLTAWSEQASAERRWIIRHALRTLVKQGDVTALRLLGAERAAVELARLTIEPSVVRLGEAISFSCTLQSTSSDPQDLIVDYIVHFAGTRGAKRPKVFKLTTVRLEPAATASFSKRFSFKPVTIRRYYPGRYRIEIQVNGSVLGGADFELVSPEIGAP
jgi:3-methyladenine DNA glycosylase AlkC